MSHSCQLPTADTIFMEHSITAVDNHNNEFNSGPVTPFSLTEMTHHDSHWNHHQDCKIPRNIPSLDSIEENFQQQQKEEILTMLIPTFSLLHHAESRYFHPRKQHNNNNSLLHESLILSIVFEFYFGTLKQRQELATCRRGERLGSILTTDSTQASSNDTMSFLLLHEMLSLRLVCKSWKYFLEKESKIIHRVAIPLIHERIRQRYDIKPMPSQSTALVEQESLNGGEIQPARHSSLSTMKTLTTSRCIPFREIFSSMGWLCAVPMGLGWKHAHKLDGTLIPQRLMSPFFLACTAMSGFLGSLMVLALVKMPVLIPVGACCLMVETIYNGISEWRMRRRLLQIEQEYEAKCEELKKWANSIKEEEFEF